MKLKKMAKDVYQEGKVSVGRVANSLRYVTGSLPKPEVGTTPHSVLIDVARTRLLAYHGDQPRHRVPILLVPSLVNRHYILDLIPERSVVKVVQGAGFPAYMVDWGVPGIEDRNTGLDSYVRQRLDLAVETVRAREGSNPVLVGYCMGGTLAILYAALFPHKCRGLVLAATPIDFSQAGLLRLWADKERFSVDRFVDAHGIIPPTVLNLAFTMLKPSWQARNIYSLVKFGWNKEFLRGYRAISGWVNDPVPVAGEAFREYVTSYYQENRMVAGGLTLGESPVDLGRVACPVLNVIAAKDHIIPPASSRAAADVLSNASVTTKEFPVGHI